MVIQFFDKDQGSLVVHAPAGPTGGSTRGATYKRIVEINVNGERFQVPLNDLARALSCLSNYDSG